MTEWIEELTRSSALALDVIALLFILLGTIEAVAGTARIIIKGEGHRARRETWLQYARWLVAALTFQLAADIIKTSIAPTWEDVGLLAAISGIRTFLNYFLERDLRQLKMEEEGHEHPPREGLVAPA